MLLINLPSLHNLYLYCNCRVSLGEVRRDSRNNNLCCSLRKLRKDQDFVVCGNKIRSRWLDTILDLGLCLLRGL